MDGEHYILLDNTKFRRCFLLSIRYTSICAQFYSSLCMSGLASNSKCTEQITNKGKTLSIFVRVKLRPHECEKVNWLGKMIPVPHF